MIARRPSPDTYRLLKRSHSSTLKCPCSQTAISYSKFVSLSPVLHHVCRSDLISEPWIELLVKTRLISSVTDAWVNEASRYFRYLSLLCELVDRQANEGVERFLVQTMAIVDVLNEVEIDARLNTTVTQLTKSIVIGFRLFMEASHSLMQVDQPLTLLSK